MFTNSVKCVLSVCPLKTVPGLLGHRGNHNRQYLASWSLALGKTEDKSEDNQDHFSCPVMAISQQNTTTPVAQSSSHGCLGSGSYRLRGWQWLGLVSSKDLGSVFPGSHHSWWPFLLPGYNNSSLLSRWSPISESLPRLRLACPILPKRKIGVQTGKTIQPRPRSWGMESHRRKPHLTKSSLCAPRREGPQLW